LQQAISCVALLAAAALPDPAPVPSVEYKSGGQVLVIGPSAAALDWAARLAATLEPSVLITRGEQLRAFLATSFDARQRKAAPRRVQPHISAVTTTAAADRFASP